MIEQYAGQNKAKPKVIKTMNESTRKTFSYSMYFPFCCFLCDGPSLTGPLTDTNILKHNDVGTIKEWMLLKQKKEYTIR